MIFLPIVARELRVTARRRRTYSARVWIAAAAVGVTAFLLPALAQFSLAQGKLLFSVVSSLAFVYCLLAGALATADCVSGEKREGTIGLLFLTDLKGYDIVLGKLVSHSLSAFYGLLAFLPVLSLALLLGGVTLAEIGRTALLFVNTLFFSMAAGVFVSTLSRHDRRASFGTVVVILFVTLAPLGWAWIQVMRQVAANQAPSPLIDLSSGVRLSPGFAFSLLQEGVFTATVREQFYASLLLTHGLSWGLLVLASAIVPRVWHERAVGRRGLRWLEIRNRWSYGRPERRRAFRARLLNRNAFYWLAARDRIKAHYVWFFVLAIMLIWVWSGWGLGSFIFDWDLSFWLLFLIFLFFKIWLVSEVCSRLSEDRASGAFELLLSSPLSLKEIARGQSLALWRQFGWPLLLVLLLTWLLMLSALQAPHSGLTDYDVRFLFYGLMVMLAADLTALTWMGMWLAVTRPVTSRAMVAASFRVLLLPTVIFVVIVVICVITERALLGMTGGGESQLRASAIGALWLSIGLLTDLFFGVRARWQFLHQFRDVATQRYAGAASANRPFRDLARGFGRWLGFGGATSGKPAWMRWLILGPALLLIVGVLSFAVWRHLLSRRVEAQLSAIQAAGEPTTIGALRSWRPGVVEKDNAASYFQKAMPYLATSRSYASIRKLGWPKPTNAVTPAVAAEINELLTTNQTALELLHRGAQFPQSRYESDWRVPFPRMVAWQLSSWLQAMPLLKFEALMGGRQTNLNQAVQAVQTLLALGHAIGQEPFLEAQSYRVYFIIGGIQALENVLNQQALSPEQLKRLTRAFAEAQADTGAALQRAFIGERCLQIDELKYNRNQTSWGGPPTAAQQLAFAFASYFENLLGIRDRRLLGRLQGIQYFVDRSSHVTKPNGTSLLDYIMPAAPTRKMTAGTSPPDADESPWRQTWNEQMINLARIQVALAALAVEQSRAASPGTLPASWSELEQSPGAAFNLLFPRDHLKYERLEQGYSIRSQAREHWADAPAPRPGNARDPLTDDLLFTVRR